MVEQTIARFEDRPFPVLELGEDRKVVGTNAAAAAQGIRIGSYCWDAFGGCASIPPEDRAFFETHGRPPEGGTRCGFCRAEEALTTGRPVVEVLELGGAQLETHWEPTGRGTYFHYALELNRGK